MNINATNDQGVVVKKVYSQYHVRVDGGTLPCGLSAHLLKHHSNISIAVGDRVRWSQTTGQTGTILDVLPRRNKLSRPAPKPGMYTHEQVIAANVDQIVPVFSTASPIPRWGLLNMRRY